MLTFLRSSSPVLVTNKPGELEPICNHFHAQQANSEQIIILEGCRNLTPVCADLLESTGCRRGLLKSTFNAENLICRLSWSISSHFGAIHSWNACRSPKSRKIHYNPYFWGFKVSQGHRCWHS